MPTLKIDGKDITVEPGTSLLEAAKQVGMKVPHFCYHPKLSIAGNCRMCLVKVEGMPKPVVSCQVTASDNMVVDTQSEEVSQLRKNVLEFILINHPIDCPVCDQAGECRLQEYYMDHSLSDSHMLEEKVHKPKRVNLGTHVVLDDERCIMCSRCIRFSDEISKSGELCFTQRGDHQTLTTFPGMSLDNPYSMNNIDICPVGALTSKDFRFNCRVWFLKKTDSICNGCSKGCNITIEHHDNVVQRFKPRDNDEVNECWLCDEGRLSYKAIHESRLSYVKDAQGQVKNADLAVSEVVAKIQEYGVEQTLFLGSAMETLENNYALKKLAASLGLSNLYYVSREVENPYSDDILIEADKNPNRKSVERLDFKVLQDVNLLKGKLVIAFGHEGQNFDLSQAAYSIALASHESQKASLRFPAATYAEQEGVFINSQSRAQKVNAALESSGNARPAWQWIKSFAEGLNRQWTLVSSEDFFKEAMQMTYEELGKQGKVI